MEKHSDSIFDTKIVNLSGGEHVSVSWVPKNIIQDALANWEAGESVTAL